MPKTVVVTGVGRDKVGIVAEVSEQLFQLGCNLLDSSMTLLRGEFALILMVQLPEDKSVEELRSGLHEIERKLDLSLHVRELADDELREPTEAGTPYMISVYSADKPGIVAGITRAIADQNMNITDVQTKFSDSGERQIFVMMLEVTAPPELLPKSVEASLVQIGKELSVDISVQQLEIYEL